jgi:hypothetical protein
MVGIRDRGRKPKPRTLVLAAADGAEVASLPGEVLCMSRRAVVMYSNEK